MKRSICIQLRDDLRDFIESREDVVTPSTISRFAYHWMMRLKTGEEELRVLFSIAEIERIVGELGRVIRLDRWTIEDIETLDGRRISAIVSIFLDDKNLANRCLKLTERATDAIKEFINTKVTLSSSEGGRPKKHQ